MKSYRRRFVAFNMLLIGIVLIVSFTALGIYMYRSELRELEKTMELVVEPWEGPGEKHNHGGPEQPASPDESQSPEAPPTGKPDGRPDGEPGARPDGEKPFRRIADEGIVTVFYNSETGDTSILSNRFSADDETVAAAVAELLPREEEFGELLDLGLIYLREGVGTNYKIALADTEYIASRTLRNVFQLALVFVGAMGLFFGISVLLSRIAARPMENAVEMERQFVQDISHDLKTPVTVVLANNSILRSNPNASFEEQRQWLDSTDDAAHSMMDLVNQMLTLSSLDAGAADGNKKSVDLTAVNISQAAEKSVLQMESVAYDRGVELASAIGKGITALSDHASVEKIMSGLIENALKYEPDGGRVEVELSKVRKKARFTVRNLGSLIDEEDLPHIFERFYRGDKARSEKGHGLGLPILKRTAELAGAELTVTSSKESGTVFTAVFDMQE
ncbi:MAG: HAMP domain-containing histidine kinase [Clostridia bacterium]|nr:HAMP domain-containing histidine kinase [Clostridia bacterium]